MRPETRIFRYRAVTPEGSIKIGTVSGTDETSAARRLNGSGLSVIDLEPQPPGLSLRRVRTEELAVLFGNVASLLSSGVGVERALSLSRPLVSSRLAHALDSTCELLREGVPVSQALASQTGVFPVAILGIVTAGDRGSAIDGAFAAAASQLEAEAEARAQLRSALAYPSLLAAMGVATLTVMGSVVIPRFATILDDLGTQLPPLTRAILWMSDGLAIALPLMLVMAVMVVGLSVRLLNDDSIRRRRDAVALSLPVVGTIRLGFATSRVCRALGGMLRHGLPMLPALDAAAEAAADSEIQVRLGKAREDVARGQSLAVSLSQAGALSPLALQMLGMGESSGRLADMAFHAADLTGRRAQQQLKTLVGLLEPAMVIALGAIVAIISAGLLQAVYSVRPG